MKKITDIRKRHKNLFLIPLYIVLISIAAIIVFLVQKKNYFDEVDKQMFKNLEAIELTLKVDLNKLQDNNEIAINSFNFFVSSNKIKFNFSGETTTLDAINYQTGLEQKVDIQNWSYDGKNILNNQQIFNSLALSLRNNLLMAQKTTDGYVIVYSSNKTIENIIFPLTENLIFTIENGEVAKDIIKINGTQYYLSAVPLYIGSKIQGMLIALKNFDISTSLSDFITSQIYYKRGYPFIMSVNGTMVVHPTMMGKSVANTEIFKKIIETEDNPLPTKLIYIWPENNQGEKKALFVKYIPDLQLFVAVTYFLNDFRNYLNRLKIILFLAIVLTTILIMVITRFISSTYSKIIIANNEFLKNISDGNYEIDESLVKQTNLSTTSKLIDNFGKLYDFTKALKENNYAYSYEPWSNNDLIGKNLISLSSHLHNIEQEEKRKQDEQKKLIWINEGISRFIEILKYQVIEIRELTYRIISHLVEYIGANQGAFFIVNKDQNQEKYIELYAAYAMQKSKLIERKIPFGVGLIGRVAIEKKILHITEIPDNYTKISTALGEGKPKSIVIVPLLFNDEIIGVIELNSFNEIDDIHIQFIERVSENISANLAMWQANQRTADLLSSSEQQTDKMRDQQSILEKQLKELESLKEQSEQREIEFSSIIKAIDTTALLVEFDNNGKIIDANNKFLDIFHKRLEEIVSKHHKDITSMDTKSTDYIFFWKDLLEGKTKRFVESFTIGEETIWLSESYVPISNRDNNVFKIFNIAIDITENKLLEKQLREQVKEISKEARTVRKEEHKVKLEREEFMEREKTYLAIIEGADSFIGRIVITTDGTIIECNKIFADVINIPSKVLLDKNIKDYIVKQDFEKLQIIIEAAKKGESYTSTINLLDAKSQTINVGFSLKPVISINNKVEKIILLTYKPKN